MDVPEENLFAMKRHDMEGGERDGGRAGYMTELVELRIIQNASPSSVLSIKHLSAVGFGLNWHVISGASRAARTYSGVWGRFLPPLTQTVVLPGVEGGDAGRLNV